MLIEPTTSMAPEDPSLARKRRMELRARQRLDDDEDYEPESKRRCEEDDDSCDTTEDGKPSIRGIKKQARYEPGVPMSKEQLKAWRKEARRVRNRESAAASRRKTRERIEELEAQVEVLQAKYSAALARIVELESENVPQDITMTTLGDGTQLVTPANSVVAPSPTPSPEFSSVLPALSPRESFSLEDDHHIISRPTAA